MANTNNPRGLEPAYHLNGNPFNGRGTTCFIPSGDGDNFFVGDIVKLTGSADATGKYREVQHASTGDGNVIDGVIIGFEVSKQSSPLDYNYGKSGIDLYPIVVEDPDVIFRIQEDGSGTIDKNTVGSNANLTGSMSSGGDTIYGTSALQLNGTDLDNQNSSNQLLVLALDNRENNELANYADYLVLINLHRLRAIYDGGSSTWYGRQGEV